MTNNFKMIINGKEIQLPFDINEMLSQFIQEPQTQIPPPQLFIPQPQPGVAQQQIIRKIVMCKDTEARKVIIDLNKRVKELEEKVNNKSKPNKIKLTMTKENVPKKISNIKKISKTNGASKNKSKVAGKKIVSKKK